MNLHTPHRRAAGGASSLLALALLTALPGTGAAAGSGLTLNVGLTPHGDGSTCGTATHVQVNVGDVVDFCYTVTNTSAAPLTYSALDDDVDGRLIEYADIALPPGGSYVHHRRIIARTSEVHTSTWTAQSDRFRYTYDDTQPLDFVDIRNTGTALDMNAWGGEREIALPFAFPFYGVTSDRICISNGGFIKTLDSACDGQIQVINENYSLVTGNAPLGSKGFIAPFWDLLNNVQGGVWWQVTGQAPNRRVIVQWDRGHVFWAINWVTTGETVGRLGAQAVLGEDGSIAFQYQKTTFDHTLLGAPVSDWDDGLSATIGLAAASAFGGAPAQYSYNTVMPHPAPSSIRWSPSAPTIHSATAAVTVDVGGPVIRATPAWIADTAPQGASTPIAASLTVGNTGDRYLDWSLAEGTAPAAHRPLPGPRAVIAADPVSAAISLGGQTSAAEEAPGAGEALFDTPLGCGPATPGIIMHDDDVPEGGSRGSLGPVSTFLDKFTPRSYPATFTRVCSGFSNSTTQPVPFDYEIVVYDDTGADGGPGNELGSLSVQGLASTHAYAPHINEADLSSLGIVIRSGSAYIGVRFPSSVDGASLYITTDEDGSDGVVPNPPEATYADLGNGVFTRISDKALLVRAVEAAPACTLLGSDVPWLSVTPTSGSVAPGAAPSEVAIGLDPTGLASGVHTANVCLSSGYQTLLVPVSFTIGSYTPTAQLSADPLVFTLAQGETASSPVTLANSGAAGSLLQYAISDAPGCDAPADLDWLGVTPPQGQVWAGGSATIQIHLDSAGRPPGLQTAQLCIATNDPAQPLIDVPVSLEITADDGLFGDGFDVDLHPPGIYTSREAFLQHIQSGWYEEGFTGVPANVAIEQPLTFSRNGFGYDIFTQPGAVSGLFNHPGVILHNNGGDQIVITFTTPVTAVGGYFWEVNNYGDASGGTIWLSLSDGSFVAMGATNQALSFRGFTSSTPITSLIVDAPNTNGSSTWAKLDNLIVGRKR